MGVPCIAFLGDWPDWCQPSLFDGFPPFFFAFIVPLCLPFSLQECPHLCLLLFFLLSVLGWLSLVLSLTLYFRLTPSLFSLHLPIYLYDLSPWPHWHSVFLWLYVSLYLYLCTAFLFACFFKKVKLLFWWHKILKHLNSKDMLNKITEVKEKLENQETKKSCKMSSPNLCIYG